MTPLEQARHFKRWKQFDRQRWRGHYPRMKKMWADALKESYQQAVVDIGRAASTDEMVLYAKVNRQPIEEAYRVLYMDVAVAFGWQTYMEVLEQAKAYRPGLVVKNLGFEAFRDNLADFIRRFLEMQAAGLIQMVYATTELQLLNAVKAVVAETAGLGWSIQRIAEDVAKRMDVVSVKRATTIARTEIIRASNLGSLEGALNTGLEMKKEWLAAMQPGVTREAHLAMIISPGRVVEKYSDFVVGGKRMAYPGDPKGGAANTINCRCAIGYVFADDLN